MFNLITLNHYWYTDYVTTIYKIPSRPFIRWWFNQYFRVLDHWPQSRENRENAEWRWKRCCKHEIDISLKKWSDHIDHIDHL